MKIIDPYKYPKAVIIGNGDFPSTRIPIEVLDNAETIVVCDGAANQYIPTGRPFDMIIGDGDSILPELKSRYSSRIIISSCQETNDQTKAVKYLLERGYDSISIVGATGKREDHTIGNISLLIEYMRMGARVKSYTDYGIFIPCSGTRPFKSQKGQQISIFNFTAKNLSSSGLEYPIYTFTSWWQGTLNNSLGEEFTISADGEYIVFLNYI